ncbi:MAG: super-infection exclusion protein B [Candidatus Roizmanbacteria bacterium]
MFSEFTKNFLEWIKLKPRHLISLFAVSVLLLFLPQHILGLVALDSPVTNYRWIVGIVCIYSGISLLTDILIKLYMWVYRKFKIREKYINLYRELDHLSPEEKSIIREFISKETKTLYLDKESGVVGSLELSKIIYSGSSIGTDLNSWPYNLQPWAWEYIHKNPKVIE